MITNSVKKYALIFTGSTSLALGVFGLFVPILPTTPFLLLTSFCYLRSSKRLYNWIINHRLFGSFIDNYMNHRAVNTKTKVISLVFLWITLSISIFILTSLHLRILIFLIGIGVSIHLLILKNLNNILVDKEKYRFD